MGSEPTAGDATTIEPGIVTNDADTLATFYCDALGFTVARVLEFPEGRVHRLVRGEARLKLYQPTEVAGRGTGPDRWRGRAGFAYAALHVADVAAEVTGVRRCGGSVLTDVTNHRPGAWFALVADPEGNVWELLAESEGAV